MVRAREGDSILSRPRKWDTSNSNPNSSRSLTSERSAASPLSSGQNSPAAGRSAQFSPVPDRTFSDFPYDRSQSGTSDWVSQIEHVGFGPPGHLSHRIVLLGQSRRKLFSPWRDVPLFGPNGLVFCVCKTPVGSWARYEVASSEPFHPLRLVRSPSSYGQRSSYGGRQDLGDSAKGRQVASGVEERKAQGGERGESSFEKKRSGSQSAKGWERVRVLLGQALRPLHFVDNAPWNMCMLPQTWSAEGEVEGASESAPDGAIEVVEVSARRIRTPGEVYLVKPLGAFLADERGGKLTWKIVAIAADDPMAASLRDVNDVLMQLPGMLDVIRDWLGSCLEARPGAETEAPTRCIQGPYLVATAEAKIRDQHRAWRHHRELQAAKGEPGAMQSSQEAFTPESLARVWTRFTAKDDRSLLGSIPLVCPASESCVLFEADWLDPEPEPGDGEYTGLLSAPEGRGGSSSWDPAGPGPGLGPAKDASLESPDSVLPGGGALFRSQMPRLDTSASMPASASASTSHFGKRVTDSLYAGGSPRESPEHPRALGVGARSSRSPSGQASPKHLPQGSPTRPLGSVKPPESPSREAPKSKNLLGFRLGPQSSSSRSLTKSSSKAKQPPPPESGKPSSLGLMALKRMAGPAGLSPAVGRSKG